MHHRPFPRMGATRTKNEKSGRHELPGQTGGLHDDDDRRADADA